MPEDKKLSDLRDEAIRAALEYYKHKWGVKIPFRAGDRIQYAGRVFDEAEVANLIDSSLEFWLTAGRYAARLENELAQFLGLNHCSLVNSGSSANLLAFMALTSPKMGEKRIRPGDEVITVAAAFPTTIAPVIQYGAVPVFVDIELPGYNVDCRLLADALSEKTKAVFLAHTMGNPFNLNEVANFCERHNLWLIEDNCDALASRYQFRGQWKYTGSIGHVGTSSFYPPHHITMGEGGAVCWCPSGCDNTCKKRFEWELGELPHGYDHKFIYSHFGYNLKVTDMQAAIGCAQLAKLPAFAEARKRNWKLLREGLADLSDVFILPEATQNSDPSWFGFLMTIRDNAPFSREAIVNHLEANKIQTRMLFSGNIIKHPCFDEMRQSQKGYRVAGSLETTDKVMSSAFWVGVYPGLTEPMVQFMVDKIREFVRR